MNDRSDAKPRSADIAANLEDVSVRLSRTKTWSGLETQATYGPADVADLDYARDLAECLACPRRQGRGSGNVA